MNQVNQQPPKIKKTSKTSQKFISCVLVIVLSGAFGFCGSLLTSHFNQSNGISIQQYSGDYKGKIEAVDVSDIADKCLPTVVEIRTESQSEIPFTQFVSEGAGSGVIVSEKGHIITNHHVIDNAKTIHVLVSNGQSYQAKVLGADPQTDLAIIKIDAENLPHATVGDSSKLKAGDTAIAIGNPLGSLGGTVTTGIISALNRQIEIDGEIMTLLQTDAAINPGNSGGGLFDANGTLIGIVNAKQAGDVEGIGFAIPISDALPVLDDLAKHGRVTNRPALNLSLSNFSSSSYSGAKSGVYIVQIVPGGAADKAGLREGDRIISIDGKDIPDVIEVEQIVKSHKVGDKLKILVDRNGKEIEKTVTLNEANF